MESPTSPFLILLRSDMGLITVTSDRSVVRWTEIIHNVGAGGMFAMVMMMPSQMPLHCQCRALRIRLAYLLAPGKPSKPVLLPPRSPLSSCSNSCSSLEAHCITECHSSSARKDFWGHLIQYFNCSLNYRPEVTLPPDYRECCRQPRLSRQPSSCVDTFDDLESRSVY